MLIRKIEERAQRAQCDGAELRRLSRDLGREIPRGRLDVLGSFRSALANHEPQDPFARGYRAALADLTAAFEVELRHHEEVRDAERLCKQKRHVQVLEALMSGPALPTELGARLTLEKTHLSHILSDLRSCGLVERYDAGGGGDQRTHPYEITLRGQQMVEKLGGHFNNDVMATVQMFPKLLDCLMGSGRVDRSDLRCIAEETYQSTRVDPRQAVQAVFEAMQTSPCVTVDDDLLRVNVVSDDVELELEGAMSRRQLPELIAEFCRDPDTKDAEIFVRVDEGRDRWRRFFAMNPQVRGRTLEHADLTIGVDPPDRPYVLLYESLALWSADARRFGSRILTLAKGALKCAHLAPPSQSTHHPPNFSGDASSPVRTSRVTLNSIPIERTS